MQARQEKLMEKKNANEKGKQRKKRIKEIKPNNAARLFLSELDCRKSVGQALTS